MKLKFNKLVLGLLVFCLVAVGGISYYFSQAKQETTSGKSDPQTIQSQDTKKALAIRGLGSFMKNFGTSKV